MTPLPDKLRYLHDTINTTDTRCTNPKCTNERCVGCLAFAPKDTPDTEWEKSFGAQLEMRGIYGYPKDSIIEDVRIQLSSRDTYWKERVDRAFVILDTNIQELVTYEEGRVSKESVLTCVRRIKRELDNLK